MTGRHWDTEGRNWDTERKSNSWGFTLNTARAAMPSTPILCQTKARGNSLCLANPGGATTSPKHRVTATGQTVRSSETRLQRGRSNYKKRKKRRKKSKAQSWAGLQSSRAVTQHRTNCRDAAGPERSMTQLPLPGPRDHRASVFPPAPNPTAGTPNPIP